MSEGSKMLDDFTNSGGGGVDNNISDRFDDKRRVGDDIDDNLDNNKRRADDIADDARIGDDIGDNTRVGDDIGDNTRVGDDVADDARVADDTNGPVCDISTNSFTGDTLVSTTEGDKPIAEIEVGDIVLAYNEETGEIGEYPVTAVWSHDDDNLLTLTIDDEVIITTTDHPFYTTDGEWIAAGDLQIGTEVYSADGTHGIIDAVVITDGTAWVYNLTVDEAHTYFVGDGAWLVHNECPPLYRGTSRTNNKNQVEVANEDGLMLSDATLDVYIRTGGNLDAAIEVGMQQHYAALNQYGSIENYVHAHHTESIIDRDARTLISFTSDESMAGYFGSGNVYEITDYSNLGFFDTNSLIGNPNFKPNSFNPAEDEFLIFLFAHVRPLANLIK
jgi:hypothetical protein